MCLQLRPWQQRGSHSVQCVSFLGLLCHLQKWGVPVLGGNTWRIWQRGAK